MISIAGMLVVCSLAYAPPETPAEAAPVAAVDAAAKTERTVSVHELDALVVWGEYEPGLSEKLGSKIDAVGDVLASPNGLQVRLSKNWTATLHNVPQPHNYQPGDKLRVRAMLVDEARQDLALWVYRLGDDAPPANEPAAAQPTGKTEGLLPPARRAIRRN